MGLEFAQGGGDTGLALREAVGEEPDADLGSGGQRLDVRGKSDCGEGQLAVLGEVVADDREAAGVPGVDVRDTGRRRGAPAYAGRGARGRGNLLGIHREAPNFLGGQALDQDWRPGRGPSHVWRCWSP
ncbi:hypothetical protein ACWEQP_24220 [Streptomyces sp. NPDC004044]